MTVGVRPARREDIGRLLELYRLLAGAYRYSTVDGEQDAEDLWRTIADDPYQRVLVAEIAGLVVGTATVIVIPTLGGDGRPRAAVENVVVDGDRRGSGVGKRLMDEAVGLCRAHSCGQIFLTSNLARTGAHDFYRRLGWCETHLGFSPAIAGD